MIRPCKQLKNIFVYRKPVDFRKQVNGLSVIVKYTLNQDPLSGNLYVFFNRRADKVRILYWERNGYILFGKYLEEDKFILPDADTETITLNGEQLNWLLDGININMIQPHQKLEYDIAC